MMINVVPFSTPRVSFDTFFQFSFQPSLSPEIMPQSIIINFIPFLPLPSAFQSVYAWGKTHILNKSTLSHFQILNKSTLSHFQILFFAFQLVPEPGDGVLGWKFQLGVRSLSRIPGLGGHSHWHYDILPGPLSS